MNSNANISMKQVIEAFEGSIRETERADLRQFVVAMVSDATPMRYTPGGTEIRMIGKAIWSTAFSHDAAHVAKGINKQFEGMSSDTRVAVEKSAAWKVRRVAQLRKMIDQIERAAVPTDDAPLSLTANEQKALRVAFRSAEGNGHDFGFVGDIVKGMRPMKAQAVGAIVTSLQQKGLIEVHEPVVTNHGTKDSTTYVQFTWAKPVADIEALCAGNRRGL